MLAASSKGIRRIIHFYGFYEKLTMAFVNQLHIKFIVQTYRELHVLHSKHFSSLILKKDE